MRALTWVVLVALAALSVASGRPAVAVALGGLKALIVGLEFMELRHAHRAQLAAFAALIGGLVVVLVALTPR